MKGNQPTHLHGHTLDLILSPSDHSIVQNVKVCDFISDHALVKCSIDLPRAPTPSKKSVSYRQYHRIDMTAFRSDLHEVPFVKSPAKSVSKLYQQYIHDLSFVLDKHAPLVSRIPKKQTAEWLSEAYRQAKAQRRQLERAWRKSKNSFTRSRLRQQIAKCNKIANKDKSDFYKKVVADNSHDSRRLWQELKKLLNRVPEVKLPAHHTEKSLADRFVLFFDDKIKKIRESFKPTKLTSALVPSSIPPRFNSFSPISEGEVEKIILNSPTKSCLIDPLPTFLVKECLDLLLPSITKLVNYSLSESLVPDGFKNAVVTPLIKKPSLPVEDLKNYRPVSGLGFLSKLVERVVAKQLCEHIQTHDLDNSHQSAYKAGHSTETALLSIKNEIHLSLARGEPTALVLLDLSAAFDTIDHSTMLDCLQSWFGVCGPVLKWFTSYLTERFQSVKIGSTLSRGCKLLFGVPQGSVLGPLLFSMYTAPLSYVISRHEGVGFHFYADDTQLFVRLSHKKASYAFDKINKCLTDVKEWMSDCKLKLNPDKTEFIIFGSNKQRDRLKSHFPVDILGNALQPAESVKNLGVWLDSDLSLSQHVQSICRELFCTA